MLPEEPLPMLVADLADDEAREVLDAAASAGTLVYVPLDVAPASATEHMLEVRLPSAAEPLFYIALPLGPPTEDGCPLRIRALADLASGGGHTARTAHDLGRASGTHPYAAPSAGHTPHSARSSATPNEPADHVLGRALAGGKLVIESLIGRGGVGAVYKARHRELRMPVAVKVLHESFQHDIDFCRQFYAEGLAASRLDHPNVTRVIDFGQEPDGLLYLAMEFLAGVELRKVLVREGPLPAPRIADVMMQTCAGLSHAHARGVVHRDIKPENLVIVPGLDDDGQPTEVVKVCDFGIAQHRALPRSAHDARALVGTPQYMSPEQCRGDELDARSDVYACGVVLYELATGELPFTAERPEALLNRHQFTAPPLPSRVHPGVDPLLERVILKALAKEPADRQQSMRELRAELRDLLSPAHAQARSPSPPPTSTRPPPMASAEIVTALVHDPAEWLEALTAIRDPRGFKEAAQRLEPVLKALAVDGRIGAAWAVTSTLHRVAIEGTQAVGSRAHSAAAVLRTFEDPAILSSIAERLLTGSDEDRGYARRILVSAGVAGAYGLYGARVKLATAPAVRDVFTASLEDFGSKAWPVVRAALQKILATEPWDNALTMDLAEDLLVAVPRVGDESSGHLLVKYLRASVAGVRLAATASLVAMWGDRAKPVLVGMLQGDGDGVRMAGIAGLEQLGAIDDHVAPRLEAIVLRQVPAGDELRAAASAALSRARR